MNNNLVRHFKYFYNHRTTVLEGVRVVVFRNIDHLQRSMDNLGIDRLSTEESVETVLNSMIEEQGSEPTSTHRYLLECSMSNAWEIYQCLLFAEIESYRSMRHSFSLHSLDVFLERNASILEILKQLRDKLFHPMKDLDYKDTFTTFFRKVESQYPMHFLFTKQLQILLDEYLRKMKEELMHSLRNEVSQLPDNQLRAFLAREERDIKIALAQANSASSKSGLMKILGNHQKDLSYLKDDPSGRDAPLSRRQLGMISQLHDCKRLLSARPLPTSDYHSPTAVQTPFHENLHLYLALPPEPTPPEFCLGAKLPSPLSSVRDHYAALVFRAILLLNESLHYGNSFIKKRFPGKSKSEFQAIDNRGEHFPAATTAEEIVASLNISSPETVALAMLAGPLKEYQKVIKDHPGLQISELSLVATQDQTRNLVALRNVVFHVPDARVRNPYRVEFRFWSAITENYHQELIYGLGRFFNMKDES